MNDSDVQTRVVTVGADGSAGSEHAQRWAEDYARATGANLRLVTATDWPAVHGIPGPTGLIDNRAEAVTTNEKALASSTLPPEQVTAEVVVDAPRLAMKAAGETSDLLVVGSRGHGAVTGMLLGSVSTYSLHHAACPVVVVP